MFFSELVQYSTLIRKAAGRNEKIEIIWQFLRKLDPGEAEIGVFFISGTIRQGKLNLAWKGLSSLISTAYVGGQPVDLKTVDGYLERSLNARGQEKVALLRPLFMRLDVLDKRYLSALILGDLRQGAGEGLVRQAIARFHELDEGDLERASLHEPSLAKLHAHLLVKGRDGIRDLSIRLFQPVKPMLAEVAESLDTIFSEHGNEGLALEHKLDGIRIQVHRHGKDVKIFSRYLKDITSHFPDLVLMMQDVPVNGDYIVDGEAIGIDSHGRAVAFQKLARRTTRKKNIAAVQTAVPVVPRIFDILFAAGQDMTSWDYEKRRGILKDIMPASYLASRLAAADLDKARRFFEESIDQGNEGVVVKLLSSGYHAGKRGAYWFKIKRVHTADCVILAAERGHGRRKGWLSNLHLGVLDETRTKYLMVGKTFKGLTDEMMGWLTKTLPQIKVHEDQWTIYVKPEVVVEIEFNDVQDSPHYDSRYALRFARVKRIRQDKSALEINTVMDLETIKRSGHE
ncbi:MAG TPA: ATP-dependent DNA ligase [bacterium]